MNSFEYRNPTKILFGKGKIQKLKDNIPENATILFAYGGGSIKKNGIYDQAMAEIGTYKVIEFSGIEANPRYETLMKAVELGRKEKIDFILAVGGGSVLDAAKFIALAIPYEGGDPWEILVNRTAAKQKMAVPIGAILTLPATGSEMNGNSVISRESSREKLSFGSPLVFPAFSILDPAVVSSLPKIQIANGVIDAFSHVLEQYMTYPADAPIQDNFAEGIMRTLIQIGPKILANPSDEISAGNFMWSCTMALNGLIAQGVPTDWATHMIGHELTALYGIDHAQTLAIIGPNLYRVMFSNKKEKLAQYAERVWDIRVGTLEEKATEGIEKTVDFFHSLGVKTKLSEYTADYKQTAGIIQERFTNRNWLALGENGIVTIEKVKEIVEMSY
ncbi:iron-containing alcohol dehydrogenase [Flavihumibacter sp. UBA7668]|uniref:iron-containing alcohol dehydrogenase n=1 Tax=Flavihumibacter sp. UBA7668 TaxID=1946542 RepID=UPI0025C593FF|nr:iron-containing alcohol dehydrogenase [Flavihumibacter sp. UBA7668]